MATIATCPKCAKQLGLPAEYAATDRAKCPECLGVFSLSETAQISLPTVHVLDAAENPDPIDAETDAPESTNADETTDPLASKTAPLRSWEERLKNALALDCSEDASKEDRSTSETGDNERTASKSPPQASPQASPNFEFELDPTPAATIEPAQPTLDLESPAELLPALPAQPSTPGTKTEQPTKTLADFAAQVDLPAVDPEMPTSNLTSAAEEFAEKFVLNSLATEDPLPTAPLPMAPPPAAPSPAAPSPTGSDDSAVAIRPSSTRRETRSRFPAIAAFVVGPIVGAFLGLYGLLWLQGEQADYLGLAKVLPATLLPGDAESLPGDRDEQIAGSPPTTTDSPAVVEKEETPGSVLKRDSAVQPASANQPVPSTTSLGRIDAEEFSNLVDAAASAAGEFVEGELSTASSVKRKGQAYMALCRLAEHFDFANQLGLAPSIHAKAKQAAQIFGQVTFKASVRQDLAHIAGRWWGYDQRPNQGIFLTGIIQEIEPATPNTLCWVQLSEPSNVAVIPVLLKQHYEIGDQIGVVGSIVSETATLPLSVSGGKFVRAEYTYALQVGQ